MKATHHIVLIGLLSALLLVMQVALAPLPNVELVSFLILIYALTLPLSTTLLIALVFVTLQMLVWGMGDWVIGYYWIWPFWVIILYILKPLVKENEYAWAFISGFWGFAFGILFAINHGVLYGFHYSFIYWTKGISFDIIHAISNYIVILLLLKPTHKLFVRLTVKFKGSPYESYNKNR
jgi:energy-coupling factor transport system substrate-specific component